MITMLSRCLARRQSSSPKVLRGEAFKSGHARGKASSSATKMSESSTASLYSSPSAECVPTKNPKNPFILKPSYANFAKIQASRPHFQDNLPITTTQPPFPKWNYGIPPPQLSPVSHIAIDPSSLNTLSNYRFLISAIPRPIAFVSTVSRSGIKNLAPFSYFQIVDHDPAIFVIGFPARSVMQDTRRNLEETGECVINIVSEDMVKGMNATAMDVPSSVSEWGLSGFTPAASEIVGVERVEQAVVSFEGKLLEMKSLDYFGKGERGEETSGISIIEGVRFWVREDAVVINGGVKEVLLDKSRPVVQLSGMAYGRVDGVFELPRLDLERETAEESNGLSEILAREKTEESVNEP